MEITLTEILDERERRAGVQQRLIARHKSPVICYTMNIAGPTKTSPSVERAFKWGLARLVAGLKGLDVGESITEYKRCGPVAFFSVNESAEALKSICLEIENASPLGRLFDMDVIGVDGKKLERRTERGCIVCGKMGRSCAAGRLHSVEELQTVTQRLISDHFAKEDGERISALARESLLREVDTTPKPGLVDRANNGSHRDMTPATFQDSANALVDYFRKCVTIGINTADNPPEETFGELRKAGVEAERTMYNATKGVNTHKGIIYSMGVILGAIGRLWKPDSPAAKTDDILAMCSELTRSSAEKDLADVDGSTAGGRLYLEKGIRGIRGEAADGFPAVRNIAIPVYKRELANGKNKNDAGVTTLLHLIAGIYDTSIYNRGGDEGVRYAQSYAKRLIRNTPTLTEVEEMDEAFIEKNLSPGGCADLLAITYFLSALENI